MNLSDVKRTVTENRKAFKTKKPSNLGQVLEHECRLSGLSLTDKDKAMFVRSQFLNNLINSHTNPDELLATMINNWASIIDVIRFLYAHTVSSDLSFNCPLFLKYKEVFIDSAEFIMSRSYKEVSPYLIYAILEDRYARL